LRNISPDELEKEAYLFAVRDALAFEKSTPLGLPGKAMLGDSHYSAEDLGPVAMITYYVKDKPKTSKGKRKDKEKDALKAGMDTPYPGILGMLQRIRSISESHRSIIRGQVESKEPSSNQAPTASK